MTCDRSVVFSGFFGFPTNKTDCHDITEILLKVELNTIKQTNKTTYTRIYFHYPYIPCTSLDWKNPVQIRIQIKAIESSWILPITDFANMLTFWAESFQDLSAIFISVSINVYHTYIVTTTGFTIYLRTPSRKNFIVT